MIKLSLPSLRPLASLALALALGSTGCAQTSAGATPETADAGERVAEEAATQAVEDAPTEASSVALIKLENPEPVPEAKAPAVMAEPEVIEEVLPSELPAPEIVEAKPVQEPAPAASAEAEQEALAAPSFDHAHPLWNAILKQHVKGSNFNYGALKKDQAKFNEYLGLLHAVTPAELKAWDKNQRYAFWINVYNAHTIKLVVDNYPLKGIRSLDGAFGLKSVFDKEFIAMQPHHPKGDEDKLSLNDVEHAILRERFKDARVHAAVNCASISCPPLRGEAFVAARLKQQLDGQMKAFINDASRNQFDAKRGKVKASSIFKWFKEDFEREAGDAKTFMARFVSEDKKALLKTAKFSYLDYDWGLNDAK